ncbi:MAG: hypothetical protein RLZZ195_267 [Pseudomonadota bacterium]|jgi:hypothetical protein
MYDVVAYRGTNGKGAKLRQLKFQRDWMHSSTYSCFPIAQANVFGYGVYYDEDISFKWNGDRESAAVGILGKEHIWSDAGRSEGTVSFVTNLVFKSDKNISLLTMPVPNEPLEEAMVLSTILATSFFTGELSIVWRIKPEFANKEILIPAGTNIGCILPISIGEFNNSTITILNEDFPYPKTNDRKEYVDALHASVRETGKRLRLYKKGMDEFGNKIGSHEADPIILNVKEN